MLYSSESAIGEIDFVLMDLEKYNYPFPSFLIKETLSALETAKQQIKHLEEMLDVVSGKDIKNE